MDDRIVVRRRTFLHLTALAVGSIGLAACQAAPPAAPAKPAEPAKPAAPAATAPAAAAPGNPGGPGPRRCRADRRAGPGRRKAGRAEDRLEPDRQARRAGRPAGGE